MNKLDEKLYEYLTELAPRITDKWLKTRSGEKGSVYSSEADDAVEQMLREQNAVTNKTITSAFINEHQVVAEEEIEHWALMIAKSRVESATPIYEILDAMRKVRETYWSFVEQFAADHSDTVEIKDVMHWSQIVHSAFDQLNTTLTQLYYDLTAARLQGQQSLINELSIPVIPVSDKIGILPLIGDIDTARAKYLLETIPNKCSEFGIEMLYVDLSGVSIIDTMVAQEIHNLIKILQLLGIDSTISGIRPEVAQTSIQLGLDFTQMKTYSTLKQALQASDLGGKEAGLVQKFSE
ncbi:STAS domain-containing protein [Bacillus lacus]|uniref:STAS domain-containing protein n=1 Tax=Metabacillus lacus TaxID=1983721 RepID=A0A7X2IZK8_9BACI|nr:STAS domain-containing protein [Metabacillus lacus]MRX72372.1 STAS domain-containing protein [Metabacillus lacus]